MSGIQFFTEELDFSLNHQKQTRRWLHSIIEEAGFELLNLNYIFCSDNYLHQINVEYLDHDTYTDIITFDHAEQAQQIESDIFISIERVKENALAFDVAFEDELYRVLAHGVLHLLGYKDKSPKEAEVMREQENNCLTLWREIFKKRR